MIKSFFLITALFLLAGDFVAVCGGQVREYHSAGVALAIPEGFEHQPCRNATEIVRAVMNVSAQQQAFVVLSAQPVKAGMSAEEYAEQTEVRSRQAGGIKDLKILKRTTVPIATLAGVGRLMSFTSGGQSAVAIRAYFIREAAGSSPRVCYVLSVTAPQQHRSLVVPTLGKITQTLKLIEFRHPSVDDIAKPFSTTIADEKRGYSISVPYGWHWKRTVTGMELGVTDYLLGGVDSPSVNITVASIGLSVDATDCGLKFLGMLIQDVSAQGLVTKPLSRGETKMGGLDAYQVVVRQAELSTSPRGNKAAPPNRSRIVIQRTICAMAKDPAQDTPQRNSYVLTVICRGDNAAAAVELMEKLSAGFTILAPAKPTAVTNPAGPAG